MTHRRHCWSAFDWLTRYKLLLTVLPLSSSKWCTIPCVLHQMHSMKNLLGFEDPCGTWSESNHWNLRWLLSNAIHFSSPVKIESKKLAFLTIETDWQVTILLILRFRSAWKESTSRACTRYRCHVMRWLLLACSIQTRLPFPALSRSNQRLQQPSKIDDRGFEGDHCTGGPGETGCLLWIWQITVRKIDWNPLDLNYLKPALLLWCFCPGQIWKEHMLL